jgi:hypothetical protein
MIVYCDYDINVTLAQRDRIPLTRLRESGYKPVNTRCDILWLRHNLKVSLRRNLSQCGALRQIVARQYATFPEKSVAMIIATLFSWR